MPQGFSVIRRNYGHWDFVRSSEGRLFRLRGGPGEWRVIDERPDYEDKERPPVKKFKEQAAAVSYITSELMHELLTVEGQEPYVMEGWNIG